jgi:hypothetical protein
LKRAGLRKADPGIRQERLERIPGAVAGASSVNPLVRLVVRAIVHFGNLRLDGKYLIC